MNNLRLANLHIKNFRKIENLTINFSEGISLIVGENNCGKTAIIDALRLILFSGNDYSSLRINEDDFRRSSNILPIEISCEFTDLSEEEEAYYIECLVPTSDSTFDMCINLRATLNKKTLKPNIKVWGGMTEGGAVPSNLRDKFNCVYLQPLRDPSLGLRPGVNSQISHLLKSITSLEEEEEFVQMAKTANEGIHSLEPITKAQGKVDEQFVSITGEEMAQKTSLIFIEPTFSRIIAGLQTEIDDMPFLLNGLGYNNLIFTSITLGAFDVNRDDFFKAILIEEPEAHLHPQLQVLLFRYLVNVVKEKKIKNLQIIVTSHSPILASQASINSVISVSENDKIVSCMSVSSIQFEDEKIKKKLERYLDATRAELFFARKIIMVEGISEALLMPILAKICKGDLKESGVTIINTNGLNFNAFIPLFKKDGLPMKVAIISDGDPSKDSDDISYTARGLESVVDECPNMHVGINKITFEHELACSKELLPYMLEAFKSMHKKLGAELEKQLDLINGDINFNAESFFSKFVESKSSKGIFAQELAAILEDNMGEIPKNAVPKYISDTFVFLGVIENEI